jgi:hypothetical protein
MPGHNTGTNTIIFIRKNQVPTMRAKDVTYGLITCLVQPEKLDEPNRTRLVAYITPATPAHPPPTYLPSRSSSTASSQQLAQNS